MVTEQLLAGEHGKSVISSDSPIIPLDNALRAIFVDPAQETLLQKTRHIMGNTLCEMPDEELEIAITEFLHIIDYWLDIYEEQAFGGSTLLQMLREN